ncbi:hypothetical protein U0070_010129, partial [Myodes glareolus]
MNSTCLNHEVIFLLDFTDATNHLKIIAVVPIKLLIRVGGDIDILTIFLISPKKALRRGLTQIILLWKEREFLYYSEKSQTLRVTINRHMQLYPLLEGESCQLLDKRPVYLCVLAPICDKPTLWNDKQPGVRKLFSPGQSLLHFPVTLHQTEK